jgi:hypothetical protein
VTQRQHDFEGGCVHPVIPQNLVKEDRHRYELMDEQRILSRL